MRENTKLKDQLWIKKTDAKTLGRILEHSSIVWSPFLNGAVGLGKVVRARKVDVGLELTGDRRKVGLLRSRWE